MYNTWNKIAIERYEREVTKPTIEVAAKITKILGVTLDYLVSISDLELDKKILGLITEIQKMPDDIKEKILYFINISIKDYKTRQAYGA